MQDHQSGFSVQFPEHEQLKCPRCDSANTKFCYYNNYNLSQPRHFCKNCRRYWTKGGTLRNIPVGGGCRKNSKRSAAAVTATSRQQIQQQEPVVQNPSALNVPASDLGSVDHFQNPSLKAEPDQIVGVGSVSDGAVESFTSLLGLDSEGQFGNFLDGFGQNRENTGRSDGSSQNTGQGSRSSSNGFMVSRVQIGSEANYWASSNTPGYKLQ